MYNNAHLDKYVHVYEDVSKVESCSCTYLKILDHAIRYRVDHSLGQVWPTDIHGLAYQLLSKLL